MTVEPWDSRRLAEFYDQRYEGRYMEALPKDWVVQVIDTLAEIAIPVNDLLDYGCGQGTWIPLLAHRFPAARISGLEISTQALAKAKRKFPDYNLVAFDGSSAPFDAESFDLVFCFHVLEHVADLETTIADLVRLVRKGGRIVAILPSANENSLEERIVRQVQAGHELSSVGENRFFYEDAAHLRRLKTDELVCVFAAHGVSLSQAFYANRFWAAVSWMARMGSDFILNILDFRRGRTRRARAKLLFLRSLLLFLSAAIRIDEAVTIRSLTRPDADISKRLILVVLIPLKVVVLPVTRTLALFALLEWRFGRTTANGSTQYLILYKEGGQVPALL
jgi:ubiquinone/menaquinone biosynthesis C-methylase UbiE